MHLKVRILLLRKVILEMEAEIGARANIQQEVDKFVGQKPGIRPNFVSCYER